MKSYSFAALWLVVVGCIAFSDAFTPVVFPSLTERHGFVYHEARDRVISLPGGIQPLVCTSENERTGFGPADKNCTNVVVFTSQDVLTLQILNLSTNGVITPLLSIPRVTFSREVVHNFFTFGSEGSVDNYSNVQTFTSEHELEEESLASASAPLPNLEEEAAAESSIEPLTDEEAEAAILDDLIQDLPEDVEEETIRQINITVLEANQTIGFMTPDGTLRSDQVFFIELRLEDLPDGFLAVNLDFGNNSTRSIYLFRDSSRAQSQLKLLSRKERSTKATYQYEVLFGEYIFNRPNEEQILCSPVREPLQKFSSEYLQNSHLEANDLASMMEASSEFSKCSSRIDVFVPEVLVEVRGTETTYSHSKGNLKFEKLREGRTATPSIVFKFTVDLDIRTWIEIDIRNGIVSDLEGKAGESFYERFLIEELNRATRKSIDDAQKVGKTTKAVTTTTVATSVSVSIGCSMAASMTGTSVATSSGGMTAGGSANGALDVIQQGQMVYLITKMSVPNLPENFKAFAESFSWTMMDMRLPWENRNDTKSSSVNNQVEVEGSEVRLSEAELSEVTVIFSDRIYERLMETCFWGVLWFACLFTLHCFAVAFFFWYRWELPSTLRFPRLELLYLYWGMPAFAGAAASLLVGTKNQKTLGIVLICCVPAPFLLWHLFLIFKTFIFRRPENLNVFYEIKLKDSAMISSKKINYVQAVSENESESDEIKSKPLKEKPKQTTTTTKKFSYLEWLVLTPLLGPPYPAGKWKTAEGPSNKFVDRFGPAFEENATFDYSEEKRSVQRGQFKPIRNYTWTSSRVSYVIQVSGNFLQQLRMIFIACFILGQDEPSSTRQTMTLLILSVGYLFILRIFRPHTHRWQLAASMIEELLRIGTYSVILYLLEDASSEDQEIRRHLGFAMLVFEGIGMLLSAIQLLIQSFSVVKLGSKFIYESFKKRPKILKVISDAQLQNPRCLERKYFRRWVKNTLGRGIYAGIVRRDRNAPFEEKFWASPGKAMWDLLLPSCSSGSDEKKTSRGEL